MNIDNATANLDHYVKNEENKPLGEIASALFNYFLDHPVWPVAAANVSPPRLNYPGDKEAEFRINLRKQNLPKTFNLDILSDGTFLMSMSSAREDRLLVNLADVSATNIDFLTDQIVYAMCKEAPDDVIGSDYAGNRHAELFRRAESRENERLAAEKKAEEDRQKPTLYVFADPRRTEAGMKRYVLVNKDAKLLGQSESNQNPLAALHYIKDINDYLPRLREVTAQKLKIEDCVKVVEEMPGTVHGLAKTVEADYIKSRDPVSLSDDDIIKGIDEHLTKLEKSARRGGDVDDLIDTLERAQRIVKRMQDPYYIRTRTPLHGFPPMMMRPYP